MVGDRSLDHYDNPAKTGYRERNLEFLRRDHYLLWADEEKAALAWIPTDPFRPNKLDNTHQDTMLHPIVSYGLYPTDIRRRQKEATRRPVASACRPARG